MVFKFRSSPVPKKVISRIVGGLGNQLFCYAAARRLALVNGAEIVLDRHSGFIRDLDYKRQYQLDHFHIAGRNATGAERLEPFARIRRYAKRRWNDFLPFEDRSYIRQEAVAFDPRLLRFKPHGTVYLEGYWQGEGYFKDVESVIRADLKIRPPQDGLNVSTAALIRSRVAVAVHVRFFDLPTAVDSISMSHEYFARAVAHMEHMHPDAHYFLFSDRPEAARHKMPLSDDRITLVSHNTGDENAYADLWLMTQCQHFIIANSTFSWWGAWLAVHPNKLVIAPALKISDGVAWWGFDGLLPPEWIQL